MTEKIKDSMIFSPGDQINYEKDSIVSKEITKNAAGNLTLFAFDEGQEISEHSAPFNAIIQILDGEAEITINSKPYHLKRGEMIIMPANNPHAVKSITAFKMMLIMIKG